MQPCVAFFSLWLVFLEKPDNEIRRQLLRGEPVRKRQQFRGEPLRKCQSF